MANGNKKIYLPLARKHVTAGGRWAHELGTDYWLQFPGAALDILAAASTATGDELAENGWVSTSLVAVVPTSVPRPTRAPRPMPSPTPAPTC
jgi:hypothetical protein